MENVNSQINTEELTEVIENIKGKISPINELISGCKFHPRCNCAFEKCKTEKPTLKQNKTSNVACFLCN